MPRTAGIAPITIALKVDMDDANKQAIAAANETTQAVVGAYSRIGALKLGAVGAVIGAIGGVATAMLFGVGAAKRFEESFAGIRKTVDASEAQFAQLAISVREMSTQIPISANELNNIGELGGQLGVSTSGLPTFIDTIAKLGVATRLSTETAALSMARLQTIFELPERQVSNLASSLVDLGNNFAALEDEILSTSLRLAAGAKVAGATAADTLAIATALQAVGVQSQAGGTAMARVFQALAVATTSGGKQLDAFLRVTQLTEEQFRRIAAEDPAQALNLFIQGISRIAEEGGNYITILEDLNLKQQRTIRAILATAEAGDLLTETLATANSAYDLNIALNEEAEKRFDTLTSETRKLKNAFTELRTEVGMAFLPLMKDLVIGLQGLFIGMAEEDKTMDKMNTTTKVIIGTFTLLGFALTAAAGQFFAIRAQAAAADMTVRAFKQQIIQLQTALEMTALGTNRTTVAFARLTTAIGTTMSIVAPALLLIGLLFARNAKENMKAQRASDAYMIALSRMGPLQSDINKKQQEYNDLLAEGAPESALSTLRREIEILNEAASELGTMSVQEFLNIPKGMKDVNADEAQRFVDVFETAINPVSEFNDEIREVASMLQQRGDINPYAGVSGDDIFVEEISNILGITEQAVIDIVEGPNGLSGLFSAITVGIIEGGEDVTEKTASAIESFVTRQADAISHGAMLMDLAGTPISEDLGLINKQIVQDTSEALDIASRVRAINSETDQLLKSKTEMLESYNVVARETAGLPEISLFRFDSSPEAREKVFKVIAGNVEEAIDPVKKFNEQLNDMVLLISDGASEAVELSNIFEGIGELEIFSEEDLANNIARVQKLKEFLFLGVSELVEQGFGGLAAEMLEEGLNVDNLSKMFAILQGQIPVDTLEEFNQKAIEGNEDFAQFENMTVSLQAEFLDQAMEVLGVNIEVLNVKERQLAVDEAAKRVNASTGKTFSDILGVVRELVNMNRQIVKDQEEINDLTEEIANFNADIVFQNNAITQSKKIQVEIDEARVQAEEAIAEFGLEGVITDKERLDILQGQMNIQKLRDRLEGKMDARQRKSIRDKQKEVKFLELAVEQGVVDQLDLDAAREELDEMKSPLTDKEKEILELQLDIAEAEQKVLETRAKALSSDVINSFERYNKELDTSANRADELAGLQEDLRQAIEDQNMQQLENLHRIREINNEYPNLQSVIGDIANLIGVPASILDETLNMYDVSYARFLGIAADIAAFNFDNTVVDDTGNLPIPTTRRGPTYNPQTGLIINGVQVIPPMFNPKPNMPTYDPKTGRLSNGQVIHSPMNNYTGGNVPIGRSSIVGEMGPELIMSTESGTSVFRNKTGGGSMGTTIENLNVNITGLPADPITSRKVVMNIQNELRKLETEGRAGLGLRNR